MIRTTHGYPAAALLCVTGTRDVHHSRRQTWGNGRRGPCGGQLPLAGRRNRSRRRIPGRRPAPLRRPIHHHPPTFHVKQLSRQDVDPCAITLHSGCPPPRKVAVAATDLVMSPGVDCRRSVRDGTRRHGDLEHGAGETTRGVRSRSVTLREHAEPGPSRRVNAAPPAVAGKDRPTVPGGAFSPDRRHGS